MLLEAEQLPLFEGITKENFVPTVSEIRGDDKAFLRSSVPPDEISHASRKVSVVDLFSGVGGLTLGLWEAARSLGMGMDVRYAADFSEAAISCYRKNFPAAKVDCIDLRKIFEAELESSASDIEKALAERVGQVDLLVGGPPCQGHSDLNNYSRRNDPKNHLYKIMGRAAQIFNPEHVIIENVPGAAHDRSRSVATTIKQLKSLGYTVTLGVVEALKLGVPQSRKRLIVIGSKSTSLSIDEIAAQYSCEIRDVRWAIEDLEDKVGECITNTPANSSKATRERIDYLYDNLLYDLPDSERPPCHRSGNHSYKSIYGRLSWDRPSQTITSGFYSMCMGRYVHPTRRRTLTAHEAARLQFLPDYFDLRPAKSRTALAQIIGNVVPPKMVYPFARELLIHGNM